MWDVLSWIAFAELRPRADGTGAVDFTLRWGHSFACPTLEALNARAASEPYCTWQPLELDGQPWDGDSYAHPASSPNGPQMLRWIARQARGRLGRVVTFEELAAILRSELDVLRRDDELVDLAKRDLLEALRAGILTGWGKRDTRRGEPNLTAEYEAIKKEIFLNELVGITVWGTVGADPEHPTAKYRGPSFSEVRFYSADVLQVFPPRETSEPARKSTVASERELVEWLTKLMRSKPHNPMSKVETKRAAEAAKLRFSERAFNRAWTKSIETSGAGLWSKPGRKS